MTTRKVPAELLAQLPPPPPPVARFRPARRVGNLVYLSGLAPLDDKGKPMTGKVGSEVTPEEAKARARRVGLALLSNLQAEIGSLDKVDCVVKLLGFVNAAPGFDALPGVIDGCSDVFIEAFGEDGTHARSSVGAAALPGNITVEVEAVIALK